LSLLVETYWVFRLEGAIPKLIGVQYTAKTLFGRTKISFKVSNLAVVHIDACLLAGQI